MLRPRPYLSYSQMVEFETSPEKYVEKYIYGQRQRISRNIAYGKKLADGLEVGEATGDPLLDLVASRMPKFERMDMPVEFFAPVTEYNKFREIVFERTGDIYHIPVLENSGDDIPLLAVPDTAKRDYSAFKEYKTSVVKWTQRKADESRQITFYATAMWLVTGKIPQDIELINAELQYNPDGSLSPTGNIYRFQTKRTLIDIMKLTKQIRTVWKGIKELCEKELL